MENSVQNNSSSNQNGDSNYAWFIFSYLSWFIYEALEWYSYRKNNYIWKMNHNNLKLSRYGFFPLEIDINYLQEFILIVSAFSFLVFFYFTTIKRDGNVINGMFGGWAKFHFVPLLIFSAIQILAINVYNSSSTNSFKFNKTLLIFDIIFTILGIASLIFIIFIIKISSEWYVVMALKKGVFSILLVLLLYNLFYVIVCLRMTNYYLEDTSDPDSIKSFIRGTGISFSIIIGILTYIFAFFFKDLMSLFVMFLIYVGLLINFFNSVGPSETQRENLLKSTDGIIDIVMMFITIAVFVFLGWKYDSVLF